MKIGFNTLYWTPFLSEKDFFLIEKVKKIGYDGIEVPLFEGNLAHYQSIGRFLEEQEMESTALAIIPDESRSPISSDPENRRRGFDHLKWAIDCCHAAGSKRLVGPFYQPLGSFTGHPPTVVERKFAAEVHRNASEYAREAGIILAVEPLNRFECHFLNTHDQGAAYVREVDHPNFHMMFDTFHANIEEKDPVDVLERNFGAIRHIHISENDRGAPGTGHVPWEGIFETLVKREYDGWLTVEAFSCVLPELAAATCVWREFDSSEEVLEKGYRLIFELWTKYS